MKKLLLLCVFCCFSSFAQGGIIPLTEDIYKNYELTGTMHGVVLPAIIQLHDWPFDPTPRKPFWDFSQSTLAPPPAKDLATGLSIISSEEYEQLVTQGNRANPSNFGSQPVFINYGTKTVTFQPGNSPETYKELHISPLWRLQGWNVIEVIPEPSSILLLICGLSSLIFFRKRFK